ncbi:DNA helicase [Xenorhabdus sp. Flor]|uniref:AAA domain-containing protein n=1 Tax=Xenorhabdus cabanillasii TaxID=351673 RepID=UPI0019CE1BAB|nr:AAA domain-containing protein [Xenorhabdus sp. Flor]MBD2814670.1 DNA helicase [Xenorhabdus sp. Flor]
MDRTSLAFASYWRNSLADATFGKGAFEDDKTAFSIWHASDILAGRLDENTINQFFHSEPEDVKSVNVILRPQIFLRRILHGKERASGAPQIITPLVTTAVLSREGYLYPTPATIIPRDLLEPLPQGSFSIGDITQFDTYTTTKNVFSIHFDGDEKINGIYSEEEQEARKTHFKSQWEKYLKDCDELLSAVAGDWLKEHEQYEKAQYGFIQKKTQIDGASKHVIGLYDHLIKNKRITPLFARFTSNVIEPIEPLLPPNAKFTDRLGHSGDKFPLAKAQRDSLSHFLNSEHGEILAVNGPPGTGKTTLILSVIATLWAKAALAKAEPPVIIATSTNNQAVTNIIEAFGKDFAQGTGPMAGRWLPKVKSFGAYFPSKNKKDEADKKYQTHTFFNSIESKEFLEDAEEYYLTAASKAFPKQEHSSVEMIVELLHQQLQNEVQKLSLIQQSWQKLCHVRTQLSQFVGLNTEDYMRQKHVSLTLLNKTINKLENLQKKWLEFQANESLTYSIFSWIPAVKNKRHLRIKIFLEKESGIGLPEITWSKVEDITARINEILVQKQQERNTYQQELKIAQEIIQREEQAAQDWKKTTQWLGHTDNIELDFTQADELVDTQIRFPIFLITTHYWEGRWLLDMLNIKNIKEEKKKNGRKASEPRWKRRMKITPCVVMTSFMLPANMTVRQYVSHNNYDYDYLYDFADLLIVDEAGQVLPEVAAASFALAKKALIIGDTEQIAPIWNVPVHVDIGNMLSEKIINAKDSEQCQEHYAKLTDSGKTAAAGSVMKIAQQATRYQYDPDMARGMYLYEHRRCIDNIINYCNNLCYHGKLIPKRGPATSDNLFPAMGYLHVDGKGVITNSGSRNNRLEAETIAAWIAKNKATIEAHYKKELREIIGVVTPFSAQVSTIKQAFKQYELNQDEITVGTVHSLQGAERHIVIFSSVYSKHEDGTFIDLNNSMLNVAVSRAKDSFLVFGDMDLFELQSQSEPRGLLAKYLFTDAANALHFELQQRNDLTTDTITYILHGVKQHDDFLKEVFAQVKNNVTVVSPWLSYRKLEETGLLQAMSEAQQRGIKITIVTDKEYNIDPKNHEKRYERQEKLKSTLFNLEALGISTKLVKRVHSKIVIGDTSLLCMGSFNWFSATRDEQYQLYDTSLVYRGKNLEDEILTIENSLEQRQCNPL